MARINQGYQKKTTETIYKPLKGLTSKRPVLAEPDTLVECENFVFLYGDTLATRPAIEVDAYIPNESIGLTNMDFGLQFYTTTHGKNNFVFNRNRMMYYKDEDAAGSFVQKNMMGTTTTVFTTDNVKDAVVFKDSLYVVEGNSTIIKWSGASHAVATIEMPETALYGNPVSICQSIGRLFVVTDKNYLRYTAVDSDTVWEDRVLMGGQITAATDSLSISGSETTFTQVDGTGDNMIPGVGVNIVITNGTTECNLTIADITSTTQMTVTSMPTISGTDLTWYLAGIDYYEPIETGDGKELKFIRPFGNNLAISRGSKKTGTKGGGLTILTPQPQDNTQILAINQRNITQSINIFPYSLCEYEDSLVFLSETGLYGIPAGNEFSKEAVKLTPLSKDKIEHITKLLDIAYEQKIRIHRVSNDKYNMLIIPTVRISDVGEPKRFLTAFETKEGFEFTELTFSFEYQSGVKINSCHGCGVVDGSLRMISDRYILKSFIEGTVLVDMVADDSLFTTVDSVTVTADSVLITADAGAKITGKMYPIYKHLKTGLTSNNNLDWMRVQKMYLFTAESAYLPNSDLYSIQPYMIGSKLSASEEVNLLTISKKYEFSQDANGVTIDSEIVTIDSELITIDSDNASATPLIKQHSYYVNARSIPNVGLKITDTNSQGYMEIYGYGFSGLASKFV